MKKLIFEIVFETFLADLTLVTLTVHLKLIGLFCFPGWMCRPSSVRN